MACEREVIMKRPVIEYSRSGRSGNIYYILGMANIALRKQHRITDYNNMWEKVQKSKSYEEALDAIREYCDLVEKP